ncbi:DNA repair exonuclease [Chloroflexi bacterium]|nr:DNA repair exonuclease [Chloroflexota bacterium]
MARQNLRIVHTSDTHLGDDLSHPTSSEALVKVVSETVLLEANFLLIAGDVFDHQRVPDSSIIFFLDQIYRLDIPTILLPGNHDLMHESSIYKRKIFEDSPDNLFIFGEESGEVISFKEQGIKFWGKAMYEHSPLFHPLSPIPEPIEDDWFVGMGHGHFEENDINSGRSSIIIPQDIFESPFDYIALGHWDLYTDVSQGTRPAVYSGCPMVLGDKNETGSISLVDLDSEKGTMHQQWFMKS